MGKRRKESGATDPMQEPQRIKAETELYGPVKAYLQSKGYEVRGEVKGCDVVGVREDRPWPVIIELKRRFNLSLVLQAVERLRSTPEVYIAAELTSGRGGFAISDMRRLCLMLGIGLLTVKLYKRKPALVEVHCVPGEDQTRLRAPAPGKRTAKLLAEFQERTGDYNAGGAAGRKLVTAYREKALRCARALHLNGPLPPRRVKELACSEKAPSILRDNVYGWFRRISRGVYELTPSGAEALAEYSDVIAGHQK